MVPAGRLGIAQTPGYRQDAAVQRSFPVYPGIGEPVFEAPQFGHRSGRRDHTRHFGHCVCARSSEMCATGLVAAAAADVMSMPVAIVPQAAQKYKLLAK
jgi:hypothetical protein